MINQSIRKEQKKEQNKIQNPVSLTYNFQARNTKQHDYFQKQKTKHFIIKRKKQM